jgi:hypothetical protein
MDLTINQVQGAWTCIVMRQTQYNVGLTRTLDPRCLDLIVHQVQRSMDLACMSDPRR